MRALLILFAMAVALALPGAASGQGEDRPLKIVSKPVAYGFEGCGQQSGMVVLLVTFHESGKVTEAVITSPSGCPSWDKKVIKAAMKIKFKPALKNGVKITVTKNVEYAFAII